MFTIDEGNEICYRNFKRFDLRSLLLWKMKKCLMYMT